ncbi:MAG: hypothetical protein ACOKSU_07355 [Pseudomonas sp.]|uniref:Uncharacterized protein n=2 Tax=Pseudomonas TaxID=286 RepID=A0ABR6V9A3_9PSED|nr:hypothetical protein [Pseudomonas taiwanensis]MBC3477051.1 hypothetical protein [Pseudomonas taiwanensis]MDT8926691.1 hypothetical protein [Pseudomonas taiwanensis]
MNAPFIWQMNNLRRDFLPRHGRAQPMTLKPWRGLTLTEKILFVGYGELPPPFVLLGAANK